MAKNKLKKKYSTTVEKKKRITGNTEWEVINYGIQYVVYVTDIIIWTESTAENHVLAVTGLAAT